MPTDFHRVCRQDAIPCGAMRCFRIDNRRILLARVEPNQFHAVDEMCTHEEASLCDGALRSTQVKCPLHGSHFDLISGAALEEPADEPLAVHQVRLEQDWVWVALTSA